MSILLLFLAGIIFLAGILFIKPHVRRAVRWQNVLIWAGYVSWFGITAMGISFVYLNAGVGHVKATSTAIFLFGGLSVILAIVMARVLGFLGSGKKIQELPS